MRTYKFHCLIEVLGVNFDEKCRDVLRMLCSIILIVIPKADMNRTYKLWEENRIEIITF